MPNYSIKKTKNYKEIPTLIRRQLYRLGIKRGVMKKWLKKIRMDGCKNYTIYWLENSGKVLSWALVGFEIDWYNSGYDSGFYTRLGYRNRGLASILYKEVSKDYAIFRTHPYDEKSIGFFNSVKKIQYNITYK